MSATVIENDLDTDLLSVLDFEFAPPCEVPKGCDNTAEWKVTVSCCGQMYLMCQVCVDHLLEWHRDVSRLAVPVNTKCVVCKTIVPATDFIFSMERI